MLWPLVAGGHGARACARSRKFGRSAPIRGSDLAHGHGAPGFKRIELTVVRSAPGGVHWAATAKPEGLCG